MVSDRATPDRITQQAAQVLVKAATIPALMFQPWSKQQEVMRRQEETRLLAWANRTGKTTVGACECVLAAEGVHPYIAYPSPPFTIWAVSNSYKQMEDSIVPSFEGDSTHPRMLPPGVTLNRQRMEYVLPGGSKIRLKTSESGRESFQGAAIPLIWLDEDIDASVLKEIFIRIGSGFRRRILWTITAVDGLTYSYQTFYLPWLEARQRGFEHPDIYVSQAAMDENPHISAEEIDKLLKFYPPNSKEYKVRRYGGFENLAGDSVFPEDVIIRYEGSCRLPSSEVRLEWDNESGLKVIEGVGYDGVGVSVWNYPESGHSYCIGADVAEGKLSDRTDRDSDRDYSVACVFDRGTREYVARLHCRLDPHTFGFWLYMLGCWYNWSWLCPEINNNGVAVLGVLRGTVSLPDAVGLPSYSNIYARETHFEQYSAGFSADKLGWRTTPHSRPKLVSDFYTLFCDGPCGIYDMMLIEECKSFQRNKLGKPEHTTGFHDDILFAAMLAYQADLWCPPVSLMPDEAGKVWRPGMRSPTDEFCTDFLAYAGVVDNCEDLEEDVA